MNTLIRTYGQFSCWIHTPSSNTLDFVIDRPDFHTPSDIAGGPAADQKPMRNNTELFDAVTTIRATHPSAGLKTPYIPGTYDPIVSISARGNVVKCNVIVKGQLYESPTMDQMFEWVLMGARVAVLGTLKTDGDVLLHVASAICVS